MLIHWQVSGSWQTILVHISFRRLHTTQVWELNING